jgi:hypothetical protein
MQPESQSRRFIDGSCHRHAFPVEGAMLSRTGDEGVGVLARRLLEDGFTSIRRIEHPERRELLLCGILSLSSSAGTGLVEARMLNEPYDPIYKARHMKWLDRITACDPRIDELSGAFCGWYVRQTLQVYGSAGDAAAKMLKALLMGAVGDRQARSAWRSGLCRWLLEPKASRLARMAYGPDFTIAEYHRVLHALPLATQVSEESPSLLPVLGWVLTVQSLSPHRSQVVDDLFGVSEITSESFFYGLRRALLNNYGGIRCGGNGAKKSERQDRLTELQSPAAAACDVHDNTGLADEGLLATLGDLPCLDYADTTTIAGRFTTAGWKLLLRLPRSAVRALFEPRSARWPGKLQALEFFAAAGVRSMPAAIAKAYAGKRIFHELTTGFPRWVSFTVLFLREVEERMRGNRSLRPLLEDEFAAVVDWLAADGVARGHPHSNASWASLLRKQREWHIEPASIAKVDRNATWGSMVEEFTYSGFEVRPLNTTAALIEEGDNMKHCAGGYWRSCLEGHSRLFSLVSPDGRSTLELARRNNSWAIAQLRGPQNGKPPLSHNAAAVEVLRRCRATEADRGGPI